MTQDVIDRWTYEVEPHAVSAPISCDVCGSREVRQLISREITRGKLFVAYQQTGGFDANACLAFCEECWPRWLMWRARMGFDLHTHSSDLPCGAACIARRNGREAQFVSQMSLLTSSTDGFFLQKKFDGQPRVNGSPLLMAMRSAHFSFRATSRQIYYESVSDPNEVRRQFLRAKTFEAIYAGRAADGVLIIVEAFESWRNARNGDIEMPVAGDQSIGLHCVHLTHYRESGQVLGFWNNWGPGWGDRGHGTLPYRYLERYMLEAFGIHHGRFNPPAWHFNDLPESLSERELRRCLLQEAPRERVRLRRAPGENWVVEVYETQSPATHEQVVCIEIQNGFGLRMGWAFFRYLRASQKPALEVPELFVWPIFRRLGIGAMLDDFAAEYASAWKCSEIHLMMNEADAVIGPLRAGARLFGQARGYTWGWRPQTAPRRVATGIKHVVQA